MITKSDPVLTGRPPSLRFGSQYSGLAQTARCWLVLEFRTPTRIQFARAASFFNADAKNSKKQRL